MDIDGFGTLIAQYIKTKPSGFRLVFCVDEVGQFIAEDVKLMLSLQTIAETLLSKTAGQSFLIVTSQNDLNATIGDLNAKQAHDFSRIQGRFGIKIPLTSANADEVIQKRLLEKTAPALEMLYAVYTREQHNLKTFLQFGDSSRQYQYYKNADHFANTYPFIPYQFDLFQSAIRHLSEHNAFIGSQQSVGERSMLGVFQQVAKENAGKDIECLVTFDQMYDGIKDVLQSNIQADIMQANKSLGKPFAVKVLKALFLIKYVKGFNASSKNIAVLLLPKFDVDLPAFQKEVQEALNQLEAETYIQRSAGDKYEYLTNQEKDIETEIKKTDLDPAAHTTLLKSYLFEKILGELKVKLDGSKYPYEAGRRLDDTLDGKERDFCLHIISPFNSNAVTTANVGMYSVGRPNDLIVCLPEDKKLEDDLKMICRTEKYRQTTHSNALEPAKAAILATKKQQNDEREKVVMNHLREHLSDAILYINGTELIDISSKDPKAKVTQGLQQLIKTIYAKLVMLRTDYSEEDLKHIMQSHDQSMFPDGLDETEMEVLARLQRVKTVHERSTVKSVSDTFASRPYGWPAIATICILAKLYKRNKISVKLDGNTLEDRAVLESFSRPAQYNSIILDLEEEIPAAQLQKLKAFHQEYFNEANLGNDPKEVSRLLKQRLKTEVADLEDIYRMRTRFRFLERIGEPLSRLKLVAEKEHPYFFNGFDQYSEELLDDKEGALEAVKKFMGGQQKEIFENVLFYLESNNANFTYIPQDGLQTLQLVSESPAPYRGQTMLEAKTALDKVKAEVLTQLAAERERAIADISGVLTSLKSIEDFSKLNPQQQAEVVAPLEQLIKEISAERFIGNIHSKAFSAAQTIYPRQMEMLLSLANPPQPRENGATPAPRRVVVRKDSVKISFRKPMLETMQDLDEYLAELRIQYLKIIEAEKQIVL